MTSDLNKAGNENAVFLPSGRRWRDRAQGIAWRERKLAAVTGTSCCLLGQSKASLCFVHRVPEVCSDLVVHQDPLELLYVPSPISVLCVCPTVL